MQIEEFNKILLKYRFMHEVWIYAKDLFKDYVDNESLKLFSIFFSLVSDGNICMSLDKDILTKKWDKKIEETRISFLESNTYLSNDFDILKEESNKVILESLNNISSLSIIGPDKLFIIDDNYLYIRKYFVAKEAIKNNIDSLFSVNFKSNDSFDYKKCINQGFTLSLGQEKAVVEGVKRNLIITGGPGTGKTTSILFLLINLLENESNIHINLIAPSGKASSRMKESIIKGLNILSDDYKKTHNDIVNQISSLEESTIHRLLGSADNGFIYNKNNKFSKNEVFVVDEASMIDINLFNSLLEAISLGSRIYIMGDKNQLPSVDAGAVFEGLLNKESLKNNIVELDESKRFKKGSEIYNLAYNINYGLDLNIENSKWLNPNDFSIEEKEGYPIFYYSDLNTTSDKETIEHIISVWNLKFYSNLRKKTSNLDVNDYISLKEVFDESETSKILCAENVGVRGVKTINTLIRKINNQNKKLNTYSNGEIAMINKNNKTLDLYNGDSGLIVSFKDDNSLYFMVKKTTKLVSFDKYVKDKIFKIKDFIFYPLRLISQDEIDLAYAITIHKSQGSDYPYILVILPKNKAHPLVNRQIVYTAITRTKGQTYIYSNIDTLNKAKDTLLKRDTNIS